MRTRIASVAAAVLLIPGAAVAIGTAATAARVPAAGAPAAVCAGRTAHDINHDGHADAVIGQPFRDQSDMLQTVGAFNVLFGSTTGLNTTSGGQFLDEQSISSIDTPEEGDHFGLSPVTGFFDSDCFADVAVGVPGDDSGAGGIVVFHGAGAGGVDAFSGVAFTASMLHTGASGVGNALATGDFNGDGFDDLAIGAFSSDDVAGAVAVLYGSASGITTAGQQWFTQNTTGVPGTSEDGDGFGFTLAAGDFTGDGRADLAVGVPGEDIGSIADAGDVVILKGTASGLTGTGAQAFSQSTTGVPGTAEANDDFGTSLAAGDITGDGKADLAIGDPNEADGSLTGAGSVTLLRGATAGLTTTSAQSWTQDSSGVPGSAEAFDEFGFALAIGDFDGDGHGDLAVGVPGEDLGTVLDCGTVDVLFGRSSGLTGTGSQAWSQDTAGIAGAAEESDAFGESVQALDLAATGHSALIIGIPDEDSGGLDDNGAVAVLLGGAHGLTATGNQFIDATALNGGAKSFAHFGLGAAN